MAKNKYDFIAELLERKGLNLTNRNRILKLATEEFKTDGDLNERVKKLEESIDLGESGLKKEIEGVGEKQTQDPKGWPPKYLDPVGIFKYLLSFNQNRILSSTCHEMDPNAMLTINDYCGIDTYDFIKHLNAIKLSLIEQNKLFAPYKIKALVTGYVLGKTLKDEDLIKGWSTDRIKSSWSNLELQKWAQNNPGIAPNSQKIMFKKHRIKPPKVEPFVSKITGASIQNFRELVLHFKDLWHIRDANSLKGIIEHVNKEYGFNDKIDFVIEPEKFRTNIEHFTDVDKLIQTYTELLKMILEKSKGLKPQLVLSYKENTNNKVILSIHQLNGVFSKTAQNVIDRLGNATQNLILNQINGLSNLYVRANFENNEFGIINLWNGREREFIKIEEFQGVEHIIEFPKN